MTPSEVINNAIHRITMNHSRKGLNSAKAIISDAIYDLYSVTCDDSTWKEVCKIFLNLAMDICENENREFQVSYYRNTVAVRFAVPEISRDPVLSISYPDVMLRERESWDKHFMRAAYGAANRTTCRAGRQVGAQFVRGKVPLISGFNGVPSGYPHPKKCKRVELGCKTGEGLNLCPCNHAEINAIGMASSEGISLNGSTLYVTSRPCPQCMGALTLVRPKQIVFDDMYDGKDEVTEIAKHANIELIRLVDIT